MKNPLIIVVVSCRFGNKYCPRLQLFDTSVEGSELRSLKHANMKNNPT